MHHRVVARTVAADVLASSCVQLSLGVAMSKARALLGVGCCAESGC
jgi:hypothetical protein